MTDDLQDLQAQQEQFIQDRDWDQFHTPKSIAMAVSIEANELMEIFQWHDNLSTEAYEEHPDIHEAVEEELADVLIYTLSMASVFDINLVEVTEAKLNENRNRFDSEKSADIRDDLENWKR